MKNKILIVVILMILIGGVMWYVVSSDRLSDKAKNASTVITQNQLNSTSSTETVTVLSNKPASLGGVEMLTSKNKFFEITFPKSWKKNEKMRTDENTGSFYYSVTPDIISQPWIPGEVLNPKFSIDVENTDKKTVQPDSAVGEKWAIINGQRGVFFSGEGVSAYFFLHNNRRYSVHVVGLPDRYNVSEDEALWVLSTFKITE